jgi:hypothetical protein
VRLAELVPDGPERRRPGAAFAPVLAERPADDWQRALALLGRTPTQWGLDLNVG